MFRNYLAAALRNFSRNRLYSGIAIFGLAVGMAAVILIGLVCRNHLSYDRYFPGYENTYLMLDTMTPPGLETRYSKQTHNRLAGVLRLKFGGISAVARLSLQSVQLRAGEVQAEEPIYWADPSAFEVLPLPLFAGNLKTALRSPDNIVLTRSMARKYFGRDAPLGETLLVDGTHPMTVSAVLEDLPLHATMLESGVFASGLASYSQLSSLDNDPRNAPDSNAFIVSVQTLVRLIPGASIEDMQRALPQVRKDLFPRGPSATSTLRLLRIDEVHLFPGFNPQLRMRLAVTMIIGALILFIACVNFINLVTARASRRALEVGVRKAAGAGRASLVLQFLGESLFHVLLAACLAVAFTELSLPRVNAFLESGAMFNYWKEPALLGIIAASVIVLGVMVGTYPALMLGALRPANVLKGRMIYFHNAGLAARLLVVAQFAILIGLIVASAVIYQQRSYAARDAVRADTDQILLIKSPCTDTLKDELRALPGVRGVSCAGMSFLHGGLMSSIQLRDGTPLTITMVPIQPEIFELYGLKPLAGRLSWPEGRNASQETTPIVINETAARKFGFASPQAVVGQVFRTASPSEVMGVVPDFAVNFAQQGFTPAVYFAWPSLLTHIHVKLTGQRIPETLDAIDRLWSATGARKPIERFFLDDYIQRLYLDVMREAQAFGLFACLAVLLACLGLFGLSSATTERRTKEIGIRKAMGADTDDVMRLLVWQFTKPVLWACLIAWPLSALAMHRWLSGFGNHVDLQPWVFVAAAALALAIGLLTVSVHCYLVARAKPVTALRHE